MKKNYTHPDIAIIRFSAPLMDNFLIGTSGQSQEDAMTPKRLLPDSYL